MLARVVGENPEGIERVTELLARGAAAAPWAGRPIYSGFLSLGSPDNPLGAMWRAADLLREHRGDSHVITWAVGGVDAVEILLLTEQWWGLPARAYAPSGGWQARDLDAGFDRLQRRGLMTGDEQLTDAGRAFREEVEVRTDELERPIVDALGGDLDELVAHLDAWSQAIIDAGSYPKRVAGVSNVGAGPHFGTGLTIDTAADLYDRRDRPMLIALLVVLGIDLIVIVAFVSVVVGRRRWLKRQPGHFVGAVRVTSGELDGIPPKWKRGSARVGP